ncbi:hypothetical protein [Methylobacterium hispanicum]|uniref:hypothetical protein n=1 Tax=Methylobacterium hispanicum TaxID=270350 RepID=UPI002F2FAF34
MSEEAIHLDWHRAEAADPIDRVGHALCRHDNKNPDALAPIGPKEVGIADDGIAEMRRAEEPAWMEYAKEAERLERFRFELNRFGGVHRAFAG